MVESLNQNIFEQIYEGITYNLGLDCIINLIIKIND